MTAAAHKPHSVKWFIGEEHPAYGTVVACGTSHGEPYRWFISKQGVIFMIPLDALLEEEKVT